MVETRPRKSCFGARSAATFGAAHLSALPSLSDKLTSLRGYSQRKIKVIPQTDGRGLGHSQIQSVAVYLHVQPMDSSVRFLIGIVSDQPINQVEGNEVTEAIAPMTVEVLSPSPIPKLPVR